MAKIRTISINHLSDTKVNRHSHDSDGFLFGQGPGIHQPVTSLDVGIGHGSINRSSFRKDGRGVFQFIQIVGVGKTVNNEHIGGFQQGPVDTGDECGEVVFLVQGNTELGRHACFHGRTGQFAVTLSGMRVTGNDQTTFDLYMGNS